MADNVSPAQLAFEKNNAIAELDILKEQNSLLLQKNTSLKKKLQSDLLLQHNLYNEWKKLQIADMSRETYLLRYRKRPPGTVSRTIFLLVLLITTLLAIYTFYNLFRSGNK